MSPPLFISSLLLCPQRSSALTQIYDIKPGLSLLAIYQFLSLVVVRDVYEVAVSV